MFEPREQSSPAFLAPVEVMAFVPVATIVTELAEITTAALVFMVTSWKAIVTLLFSILIWFTPEDPITVIFAEEV
jgi:hypothetical protein